VRNAWPPAGRGLFLMQGPGYDQESTPGLVAAGATVVVFTTGRGTTIGNAIAPVIKLASNENPLGPSPLAVAAMQKVLPSLHLYPDGSGYYLKRKLADKLQVTPEEIFLGAGSNEIMKELIGRERGF
jgi:histidinol-phosphate/aromatic aminotransferase/cobyric acid decarboxylase-like protein